MDENQTPCPLSKGERILVALDGSECSEKALEQAISMAKVCHSILYAISVVEIYPGMLEMAPGIDELSKRSIKALDRARDKARKENIPFETFVCRGGQPHKYIVEAAKKNNIDLIVLGSHGRSGLKKLLMGSVTERVVGHTPCSVMIVPA
jgi:nucleotide-binding universal stress UspA family protein